MTTPANTPGLSSPQQLHADYWELVNARPEYDRAEQFYNGMIEEKYASPKVARLLSRFGLNDFPSFNLAHIAVDAVIDLLHINSMTIENNNLDNLLDEIRDANDLDEEIPILFNNAGKFGDAYLFVWPTTDDQGNVTGVRMEQQDPRVTRVFYSEENPNEMVRAIRSWETGSKNTLVVRANLYFPTHIERWAHEGKVSTRGKDARWKPYTEDGAPAVIANPYGLVPFFHYRTSRPYGIPLHERAYGPQLAINKLVTSHLATVDYQSFPQRYALQDPNADPSGLQNGDFDQENPLDGSDPEAGRLSQLDASPNALWNLEGYKEVGQFDAANPDHFLKPLETYKKWLFQVTGVSQQAYELDRSNVSGEARRVASEPTYNKAEDLQRRFGSTHRKAFSFALEILGEDPGKITPHWKPVRNINDLTGWQTLLIKRQLGVPQDVLLAEAGYNSADIDEWLSTVQPEEEAASDETPNPVPQQAETKEMTTDERND
jgi:hypothetical protein